MPSLARCRLPSWTVTSVTSKRQSLLGSLGWIVARDFDTAIAGLSGCERLILDLRGYLGGGLGVLRLISYLTPDKLPIGYSITRRRAERGYTREKLRRFDRLPSNK